MGDPARPLRQSAGATRRGPSATPPGRSRSRRTSAAWAVHSRRRACSAWRWSASPTATPGSQP
eukprot:4362666-Alexandrium_andersonii.AAC.1